MQTISEWQSNTNSNAAPAGLVPVSQWASAQTNTTSNKLTLSPTSFIGNIVNSKAESPVAQIINQFNAGKAQITQPFADKAANGNKGVGPVKALEGALNVGAGIVNTITAPAAPLFSLVGNAINKAGEALAETPPLKAYGKDLALAPANTPSLDTPERILTAIQNASIVASAALGGVEGLKSKSVPTPTTKVPIRSDTTTHPINVQTPYIPPEQLPVIEMGSKEPSKLPTIQATPTETPKSTTRSTQTLKPIQGTGETKTRGAALSLEAGAIEKGLTDNLGDLPEYKTVNFKEMAPKIADTFAKDPESARAIALGEKAAPKGTTPEMFAVELERQAQAAGDVQTIRELANSKLTTAGTTMGQRIASYAQRDVSSAVHAIQEVQRARAETLKARGQSVRTEVPKIKDSIRKTNTKQTWGEFINEISC